MDLKSLNKVYERAEDAIEKSAKLSTKKRKNLPDSVFCGPGRSFPVNDCAHYTAALRLLNRSKYSESTKKNIRACINRRGKKLGCSGAKKKEKSDYSTYITKEMEKTITDPEFAKTLEMVEESIKNPGQDLFKDIDEDLGCGK